MNFTMLTHNVTHTYSESLQQLITIHGRRKTRPYSFATYTFSSIASSDSQVSVKWTCELRPSPKATVHTSLPSLDRENSLSLPHYTISILSFVLTHTCCSLWALINCFGQSLTRAVNTWAHVLSPVHNAISWSLEIRRVWQGVSSEITATSDCVSKLL